MNEKKLIIVLGSMGRAGAERVVSYISEHFAKQGWRVWIVMLLFNEVGYELHENVQVVNLSGNTQSRLKRLPYWLMNLRKLMKQVRPDAVLAFAARINIITMISGIGLKVKMIVSERNDPYSDGRSKVVDFLTYWLYPKAHAVVFQTKRAASYFAKLNLKNACIIPNPVSVQCKAGEPTRGKMVTVGRLTPQKNQKLLIDAFTEVKKQHPYAELHIYGEGELRADLTSQAEELDISSSVILHGNVLDVHQQIADAAMFVLPSNYEGLSNALLEAMLMGLPCISTNCAGSDEYINDGENGLLTMVGDRDGLVSAMCRFLENREEAERCGKEAAKRLDLLTKDRIVAEWYSVIAGK